MSFLSKLKSAFRGSKSKPESEKPEVSKIPDTVEPEIPDPVLECSEETPESETPSKGTPSKRVRCIETGEVFDSISKAAKHFGVARTTFRSKLYDPDWKGKVLQEYHFEVLD